MFTGIIEALGQVQALEESGSNMVFTFGSTIAGELKVDQSVSHNGVCLTVTKLLAQSAYQVIAVAETLQRSNLGDLKVGDQVNLERSMVLGGRLDGHLVQGHVDSTAVCSEVVPENGSWVFGFEFDPGDGRLVVEKGSICVNGVSLTCFNTSARSFEVVVIPYTFEHTNFKTLKKGDRVNLEFDIIGKYIQRILKKRG